MAVRAHKQQEYRSMPIRVEIIHCSQSVIFFLQMHLPLVFGKQPLWDFTFTIELSFYDVMTLLFTKDPEQSSTFSVEFRKIRNICKPWDIGLIPFVEINTSLCFLSVSTLTGPITLGKICNSSSLCTASYWRLTQLQLLVFYTCTYPRQ